MPIWAIVEDSPDYRISIDGVDESADAEPKGGGLTGRPWVGVRFDCCGVYWRIYRNPEGTAYQGHCPNCRRRVFMRVGPGGTNARMFSAD